MNFVLLSGDLMVVSRVAGAVKRLGGELHGAATVSKAIELCRNLSPRVLVVDLSTPSQDVAELVTAVKANGRNVPMIIAFGPHVHEERLAAARDAGCDHVVSRGQFMGQLDSLLQL
jgi:CheY-like chemotaxis protein